jgi:peptide/nickel transport system permease protein
MFGKKSTKQLLKQAEQQSLPDSWNKQFWQRFRKNRLAKWSLRILYLLIFIAVFADFIANERPLYCQFEGETYFPIFHSYLEDLKLVKPSSPFLNQDWAEIEYESAIFPLIPYSASKTDLYASRLNPFGEQKVKSLRWRHWLGTSLTGKDMTAGLIIGVRYALLVGLIAMSIAVLIGVLLGSLAGYYGDDKLKITRIRILLNIIGFFFGIFFAFSARTYQLRTAGKDGGFFF